MVPGWISGSTLVCCTFYDFPVGKLTISRVGWKQGFLSFVFFFENFLYICNRNLV